MYRPRRNRLWPALLIVWGVAITLGIGRLYRYSGTPGASFAQVSRWPAGLPLRRATRGVTIVMSLHPKCPCSRATIGELARVMTHGEARVYVLFVRPQGVPLNWERTELWSAAAAIPGVFVVADDEGAMSRQLGAVTSGHTCAFDESGRLLFSGGITVARGHAGDNAGSSALIAILRDGRTDDRTIATSPVFGCSLGWERCDVPGGIPLPDSAARSEP